MPNRRKTDAEHKLRGTYRGDRHGNGPGKPAAGEKPPAPPRWLPAEGRAFWKENAVELHAQDLLTELNSGLYAALCSTWAEFRALAERVKAEGHIYESNGLKKRNLASSALNETRRILATLLDSFGMSPLSRARLGIQAAEEGENELDEFLRPRPYREEPAA